MQPLRCHAAGKGSALSALRPRPVQLGLWDRPGPPGAPREQRRKTGFATKRQALVAMNEFQAALAQGAYVPPTRLTVKTFLEDWLPSAKARLRPGAYDACEVHVRRYIVPRIGELPIQALTRQRVQRLYAQLAESGRVRGDDARLSAKTVHNIQRPLCRALADAVRNRLIPHNPSEAAHRQPDSPEQLTWTPEQVRAFLDSVATDRLYPLWRLAVTTGLRRGELVGLRWRDVDLAAGRIAAVQQRAKGGGTVSIGPTKTKRGRRLVSIDATTQAALKQHPRGPGEGEGAAGRRLSERRPRLLPPRREGPPPRPCHEAPQAARPGRRRSVDQAPGPPSYARDDPAPGGRPRQGRPRTPGPLQHRDHARHLQSRHPRHARRRRHQRGRHHRQGARR
ncbi:hypothetical protein BH23ACT8_BH23ACT8_05590 [soil metagenome]